MSEYQFPCPNCQGTLQLAPEYAGMQITCPLCNTVVVAPAAPAPPPVGTPRPGKHLSMAASTVQHAATTPAMAATTIRKAKKPNYKLYGWLAGSLVAAGAAVFLIPKAMDKYQEHKEVVQKQEEATNAPPPPPPDLMADEIVKKMSAAYKSFPTYSADGTSESVIDMSAVDPKFTAPVTGKSKISMRMAKPNLYRFEWDREQTLGTRTMNFKGEAWCAGKGDILHASGGAVKERNREANLTAASAAQGPIGVVLAASFFDDTNSVAGIKDLSKTNNETLDGHKCYVLTGKVAFQDFVIWVHKDDFLVPRLEVILSGKVDEASLAGLPVGQRNAREKAAKAKGTITETYTAISTNQSMSPDSFQGTIPISGVAPRPQRPPKEPGKPAGRRGGVGGRGAAP